MPTPFEFDVCPECGSPDFATRHAEWSLRFRIALVYDRQCLDCETKYTPVVSRWVSASAVLVGGLVVTASLIAARYAPEYVPAEAVLARVSLRLFLYGLAMLGAAFAVQGLRSLIRRAG